MLPTMHGPPMAATMTAKTTNQRNATRMSTTTKKATSDTGTGAELFG